MAKDSIIHFVGFVTSIEPEDFVAQWEQYARHFKTGAGNMVLQQQQPESTAKNRFKYLSRHAFHDSSIRFSFMQGRSSEHFPEQQVKVVQAGGYTPVQAEYADRVHRKDVTILVFVSPKKNDSGFYRQLTYSRINIYEAYFENCLYNSILEFIVPEKEVSGILEQLKPVEGIEVSLYRECMVPHL